jgi:hypothetical protein
MIKYFNLTKFWLETVKEMTNEKVESDAADQMENLLIIAFLPLFIVADIMTIPLVCLLKTIKRLRYKEERE